MSKINNIIKVLFSPKSVKKEVDRIAAQGDEKIDRAYKKAESLDRTLEETITIKIRIATGAHRNGH